MPEYLLGGADRFAHFAQYGCDTAAKNPPTSPWQSALSQNGMQDPVKQVRSLVRFAICIWEH